MGFKPKDSSDLPERVVQCPDCGAWSAPLYSCPVCGHEYFRILPGFTVHDCRVEEQVGLGGFADVYKVRHRQEKRFLGLKASSCRGLGQLGRTRAVNRKQALGVRLGQGHWRPLGPCSPSVVDGLIRAEYAILDRLRGKGVFPDCREPFVYGRQTCFLMDYLEGADLRKRMLEDPGRHSPDLCLGVVRRVLKSLLAAQAAVPGFAHGDLKPENIFPGDVEHSATGVATLIDPGVRLTVDGEEVFTFTPAYNPLGLRGEAADTFALAAIVLESLLGRPPFEKFQKEECWDSPERWADCYLAAEGPGRLDVLQSEFLRHGEGAGRSGNKGLGAFLGLAEIPLSPDSSFPIERQLYAWLTRSHTATRMLADLDALGNRTASAGAMGTLAADSLGGSLAEAPGGMGVMTSAGGHVEKMPRTNPLGMTFAATPMGSFPMGSDSSESFDYEKPVHLVTISQPFEMQATEVTQAVWKAVMGSNPSKFQGDNLPVEQVSLNDVQEFLRKLNQLDPGKGYRLPTEAEWEYACRAGTAGDRYGDLGSIAWYGENSGNRTHPVGQKRPNAWGLYDMLGNVYEWCSDWYGNYLSGSVTDPRGPASDSSRVIRGGSWGDDARFCRAAFRDSRDPGVRGDLLGFRLARDPVL